jgi:hypothetical protein
MIILKGKLWGKREFALPFADYAENKMNKVKEKEGFVLLNVDFFQKLKKLPHVGFGKEVPVLNDMVPFKRALNLY